MLSIKSFAVHVQQAMNVKLYEKMLLVLQEQLAAKGYLFTEEAGEATAIPDEWVSEIGGELMRTKIRHVAPFVEEEWLANRLVVARQEGEATCWAEEMIAALREQGVFLVRNTAPRFAN
ncbi:hypothetical protein ACPRNU_22590 [Chromobacterium vaccinii]|uniref:hypothetical protein n=1 Tax=Chromobacterium vaccinii TaxID=1108595 RepID=UPI003C722AD3